MDWLGTTFSLGLALIIIIPVGVLIMFFWNSLFWFVGGLLKIKSPFWRLRVGGIIVLIIYTIVLMKVGIL